MLRSCLALILIFMLPAAASADKRAFIVGVGDYAELTDLQKTIGDAGGYEAAFGGDLGFQVTRLTDPDSDTFLSRFEMFLQSIAPGDQVVFVFSGHGWSDGSDNYLALTDAPRESSEFILKRRTISLSNDILSQINARRPGLVFAIIDACRDNPFDLGTRSVTKGLVRQELVQGTLVVYAAGARQKALDRLGPGDASPYSVFTRSLLPRLKDGSKPLLRSVDEARNEVAALASTIEHNQRPAIYSDISLDFCFDGACRNALVAQQEAFAWDLTKRLGTLQAYTLFIQDYPTSVFAAEAAEVLVLMENAGVTKLDPLALAALREKQKAAPPAMFLTAEPDTPPPDPAADLQYAERQLYRTRDLYQQGMATQEDLELAEKTVAALRAESGQ